MVGLEFDVKVWSMLEFEGLKL